MEKSAASFQSKKVSLSQGVVTRLMNTSADLNIKEKLEVIEEYYKKNIGSGYSKRQAYEIIGGV